MLRVLVGCEESGIVRRAFRAKGHEAFSNDLIDSADDSSYHLKKDVFSAIYEDGPWDIIILHPPCTYMAVSGNRYYSRSAERQEAEGWTEFLWETAKKHALIGCALENPVSTIWQYIGQPIYYQPYEFGHLEQKKTGIITYKLPPLVPTHNVYEEMMKLPKKDRERIWYMSPSPERSKFRSRTYHGIASAMAEQWGGDA